MTVQTILVPLPTPRRGVDASAAAEPLPVEAASEPCSHAGRCDRDACGQVERVARHCPSLDATAGAP